MKHSALIMEIVILVVGALSLPLSGSARHFNLSQSQVVDVLKIAKRINALNPRLEEAKVLDYGIAILRASSRYGIEPNLLIAIAQQETHFRSDLPEGRAGEIGICQIRKMWLSNPNFIREFKKQTIKDLAKPAKNFMVAAWILSELKKDNKQGTLPYWSFYNAVKFEPRLRYFLAVNRNLATLTRFDPSEDAFANDDETVVASTVWQPSKKAQSAAKYRTTAAVADKLARPAPKLVAKVEAAKPSSEGRWIPNALRKVQEEADAESGANNRGRRRQASPQVIRAAAELEVSDIISNIISD